MKRTTLLFCAALTTIIAKSDSTDWLNFATSQGGEVVESVLFRNQAKLMFGENEMVYEDDGVRKTIPYTGAGYIFFNENGALSVENTIMCEWSISYRQDTQQILVTSEEPASWIRLYSMQGTLLRMVADSQYVSTSGLPQGAVIAVAECNGRSLSKKFIIK